MYKLVEFFYFDNETSKNLKNTVNKKRI